jgi:ABC-type multidrug transport system permease subunit
MVMFTLLILFTSGSATLMMERHSGILRRLASSPMRRGAVVLGKWGSRWVLGLVQIAFAMAVGTFVFGVRWGNPIAAMILLLVYSALIAFLGILLGNFGNTIGQVTGIGVVAANLLAALGGCWWPIEITPFWAQRLAMFTPTGWTMDALHKLMNFGDPLTAILPHLAALTTAATLAAWLAARRFRFQ